MAALLAIGGLPSIARAAGPSATPTPAATSTAAPTPPPRPAPVDRNTVLVLIRTTLVAVQQANQTDNYSVLYGISAPGFQQANSSQRLSQIFANLRAKNFDLSGIVVLEPQLLVLPELYSNGVMRIAGFFPSVPMQVYFDLQFIPVQGQWRLIGIGVDVGVPTAPSVPTSQPTAAKPAAATPTATTPTATTPTATPTAAQSPSIEVNVKPKPKPTPKPRPAAAPVRP
jgi:cell division septation protein DedD